MDRLAQLLPMAVVTVITATWALAPAVAVKVEGGALLLQPNSRVGFYARTAGQVQALHTSLGAAVRAGDPLLSLSRSDQAAAGGGGIGPDPRALQRQADAINRQQVAIESQIANLRTSNQPVARQLAALDNLRRSEVIPRYSPLWVGAQDLYLRNQSQIKALEGQLAQLEVNRAELEGQRDSQTVLAPRAGKVLSLAVVPGQAVLPGQRLGAIGPGPRQLSHPRVALALFSDADATRLRRGMAIELDPLLQTRDRYGGSAQRWGLVEGRIIGISPAIADVSEVSRAVGDPDLAANLMARSRQAAFGEGGDPLAVMSEKLSAPVVLVTVALESAATPSGLRWSGGQGPDLPLENGTPARAKVEVERRSLVSFALPFLRWLGGAER